MWTSGLSSWKDRSGSPADHLWFVDYNVEISGMAVEGARVVFRVNNGNLIQFGSENLPEPGARAPRVKLSRKQALAVLADYVGGMRAGDIFVDGGSLRLLASEYVKYIAAITRLAWARAQAVFGGTSSRAALAGS